MCKHQRSSEHLGSYTTLSNFMQLNRTLCGIKHGSTSYLEKKKIIVQRRRGFSMILFPLPLARNKENGNTENRILIGCALCKKNCFILCRLRGKNCCRRSTVRDELTRIKNSFLKNIHSLPNLSFPICHY